MVDVLEGAVENIRSSSKTEKEIVVNTVKSAAEWCRENWELLVAIVVVIVACVLFGPVTVFGFLCNMAGQILVGSIC